MLKTSNNIMNRKKILILFCFFVLINNLHAQILTPVKWSYGAKKTNEKETVVFFKATIDDDWHIYSTNQMDGGPVKTSITFFRSNEYAIVGKLVEPQPVIKYEPNFKMDVHYFEKSVVFQQKIRVNKKGFVLKGKLNFMVCNDQKCLPPEDVTFAIPIN